MARSARSRRRGRRRARRRRAARPRRRARPRERARARSRSRPRARTTCCSSGRPASARRCWPAACPRSWRRSTPTKRSRSPRSTRPRARGRGPALRTDPPFRAPHHSASAVVARSAAAARAPGPGEITLAHRGALFLDELPEFPVARARVAAPTARGARRARQPRRRARSTFPADFLLIACANPCPCGRDGDAVPVQRRAARALRAPALGAAARSLRPARRRSRSRATSRASRRPTSRRGSRAAVERQRARLRGTPWRRNAHIPAGALECYAAARPTTRATAWHDVVRDPRAHRPGRGARSGGSRARSPTSTTGPTSPRDDIERAVLDPGGPVVSRQRTAGTAAHDFPIRDADGLDAMADAEHAARCCSARATGPTRSTRRASRSSARAPRRRRASPTRARSARSARAPASRWSAGSRSASTRAAHEGALDAGGLTVGVVATGLDVVYPRRHERLYERVREQGLIVGENAYGTQPLPWRFPIRNRIIAALADAVVVVEATHDRRRAASPPTHAARFGRDVYALPGSRRNPAAAGCNALIRDGAKPLLDPSDVLFAIGRGGTMEGGWTRAPPRARRPRSAGGAARAGGRRRRPSTRSNAASRPPRRPARRRAARRSKVGGHLERRRGLWWPRHFKAGVTGRREDGEPDAVPVRRRRRSRPRSPRADRSSSCCPACDAAWEWHGAWVRRVREPDRDKLHRSRWNGAPRSSTNVVPAQRGTGGHGARPRSTST